MIKPTKRASLIFVAVVLTIAGILYYATYLDTVGSSADENLIDVGEFQIVLNKWGTLHHTGYPLYTILGATFVNLSKTIGLGPADGPSLFSLFWALVALSLIYVFVLDITSFIPSAIAAVSLVAVGFTFWINAVIPEVYSLYVASIVAALLISRRLSRHWSDKRFLGLAVLLGLAGGHHRLAAFILPAVAIYLGPSLWQQRRRLLWLLPVAGLAGAATFLVYLYLPIRAWQGADFVFGSPTTWDGFWRIFFGPSQVTTVGPYTPELDSYGLNRTLKLLGVLKSELSVIGITFGLVGLAHLAIKRSERATGIALLTTVVISFVVGLAFPIAAVPGNSLLPAMISLTVGIAQIPALLSRKRPILGWMGSTLVVILAIWIAIPTYHTVQAITHPPDGRQQLLDIVAQIPPSSEGPEPVLMIPWGNDYFLAYFARYVSHELDCLKVVDHNADFNAYLAEGRPLYTLDSTFWRFPISWWDQRFGRTFLSSVSSHVVQLADKPLVKPEDVPNKINAPFGDGISLVGYALENTGASSLNVVLFFQAKRPVTTDYSISVRLTDQPKINSAEDILAQQDSIHPVFGWHPTSGWLPGEIVRTVHHIQWDSATRPTRVEVTLYDQPQPGLFQNLEFIQINLSEPWYGQ